MSNQVLAATAHCGFIAIVSSNRKVCKVKDANDFLATLEKLIKSPDAYKLSDTQYDDLTRLRDDAMGLFNNGDLDGAHAVIKEMQEIVEEGAPLTE